MTIRKAVYRTTAILLSLLLVYVWLGVAWINGQLSPWIYDLYEALT